MRLAGVSALLTFVILCAFAVAIGSFTVHRIRSDFNRQVTDTANELPVQLDIKVSPGNARRAVTITPALAAYAGPGDHAIVRIFTLGGTVISQEPAKATSLGTPSTALKTVHGYRTISVAGIVRLASSDEPIGQVIIQYGRKVSDTEATVARVELFLLFGVLAGSGLALLAGMAIARRAMSPIAALTRAADDDRAHARPLADACPSRSPTTRSPSCRARSRACSASSTRRAVRPSRCSRASGSSSRTPRTSCARR